MLHSIDPLKAIIRRTPAPDQEYAAERRLRRLELRALQEWRKPIGEKLEDAARMRGEGGE